MHRNHWKILDLVNGSKSKEKSEIPDNKRTNLKSQIQDARGSRIVQYPTWQDCWMDTDSIIKLLTMDYSYTAIM